MRTAIGLAAAAIVLASCATQVSAPPVPLGNDQIVVRTSSAVQLWDSKGLVRSLGRANASRDGSVFYALDGASPTTLHFIDAKTGRSMTQLALPGAYTFADEHEPAPSGLSPNGRWLVLVGESIGVSTFALIDTGLLKLAAIEKVPGAFSYDAISDDGTSLYLIEKISPAAARDLPGVNAEYGYRVRVYDVPTAKLSETLVVDVKLASTTAENNAETRIDGIMNGIYQSSVPSRDGLWNFSFYYNPGRGPFIHVLHLDSRNAFCILDLPIVAGGAEQRLGWSLVLAPSGKTLYATNGALGIVSSIDATTLKVTRTATIAGLPPATGPARTSSARMGGDPRRLWLTAAHGVALVDTSDFTLRGVFLPDRVVKSISLSPDARRLYALSDDGTLSMLDATTGRQLAEIPTNDVTALLRVSTP